MLGIEGPIIERVDNVNEIRRRVAKVPEGEILDRLLDECLKFQEKVKRGEAKLGQKKVEIVPPDPIGELGSRWEKMAAERNGRAELAVGET